MNERACVSRYTGSGQQDVCVSGRCLEMTDFDAAVDLLHQSQSDALGAPKVCHWVIIVERSISK